MEIGQEVALIYHGGLSGVRASFGWKVSKISPAKQIVTVSQPGQAARRFDHRGRELYGNWHLNEFPEKVREQVNRERRLADAAAAITAVRIGQRIPTTKAAMVEMIAELESKLLVAKTKVEAV
jgi:hypothetical protein